MHQIQMTVLQTENMEDLYDLVETHGELDIIEEKNFNGDLTTLTLYVSWSITTITILIPVIKTLIKHKKISSLKIDGKKIELTNVSEELIVKTLEDYLHYK